MNKTNMICDVEQHLRISCIEKLEDVVQIDYDIESNTDGIIRFIRLHSDLIRYFITNECSWLDENETIFTFFTKAVGEFDGNLVQEELYSRGYDDFNTKCMKCYFLYPLIPAIASAAFITAVINADFSAFIMLYILFQICITLIPHLFISSHISKKYAKS